MSKIKNFVVLFLIVFALGCSNDDSVQEVPENFLVGEWNLKTATYLDSNDGVVYVDAKVEGGICPMDIIAFLADNTTKVTDYELDSTETICQLYDEGIGSWVIKDQFLYLSNKDFTNRKLKINTLERHVLVVEHELPQDEAYNFDTNATHVKLEYVKIK